MKLSTVVALFLLLTGLRGGTKAVKPVAEPPRDFTPLRAHFEAAGMPMSFVGEGAAILWDDGVVAIFTHVNGSNRGIVLPIDGREKAVVRHGNLIARDLEVAPLKQRSVAV